MTVDRAAAVGHTTAAGVPALDNAGVAVTLARTGDVNEVAGLEGVSLDDGAELELGSVVKVKLTQVLLGGNASLVQVAEFRLGELRFANVLVAKLDSLITVFFAGLLLSDHAGTGLDNGDRDHMALFVEDLRHANFSADDCFHV